MEVREKLATPKWGANKKTLYSEKASFVPLKK